MSGTWNFVTDVYQSLLAMLEQTLIAGSADAVLGMLPFVMLFEIPMLVLLMTGVFRHYLQQREKIPFHPPYYPRVSCLITCYSEGASIERTIQSLTTQLYPGHIELLILIDGAIQNHDTLQAARQSQKHLAKRHNRCMKILPKLQRGGRVSSLNTGARMASGEIILALDGDTSFDNDMIQKAVRHFADPNVVALAGSLRVRNANTNIVTRLQAVEYMLSIHASKTGLDQWNAVNIISGALGAYRKSFLLKLGGWANGSAEDMDITLRIKKYFGRHPKLRLKFDPEVMGHTDVPTTLRAFFKQRLRWDGDLYFLYVRRFRHALRPKLLGWTNFIIILWNGLLFQLFIPILIIVYSTYLLYAYSASFVLALMIFLYLVYFTLTGVFFLQYLLLLSTRKREDFRLSWVLLLMPALALAARLWNGVAVLAEIFLKSHLDTTMAPWWVLKRAKH